MNKEVKVWIYCRVLSKQAESLLRYQEELLSNFAKGNGMQIIGITTEIAKGDGFYSYQFQQLIWHIKQERINAVIIYSEKRISIYEDLYEEFEMICHKHHVDIISLRELTSI